MRELKQFWVCWTLHIARNSRNDPPDPAGGVATMISAREALPWRSLVLPLEFLKPENVGVQVSGPDSTLLHRTVDHEQTIAQVLV